MDASGKSRRQFLGGLFAAGIVPQLTWADAGSPVFLSAAAKPDGRFVLCGIGDDLSIRFQLALPARGHAAAAHPTRPEAVAFARRPGTFAAVINCVTGEQKAVFAAPEGRHFYGHGTFSADGRLLFTTENDYEAGRGVVGVWDTQNGYLRIAEWDSGGIGPHDIKRLPGSDILVVANGGIDTHPDTGRTKLNIATMQPNLAYITNGTVIETAALPAEMHKNSIRHLAVGPDGQVAFGMQWQGDGPTTSLVGVHRMASSLQLAAAAADDIRGMVGYVGSIAYSKDGNAIAVTSPKGGKLQLYSASSLTLTHSMDAHDVCGVAQHASMFLCTTGQGSLKTFGTNEKPNHTVANLKWDNHLVRVE